MRRAASVALALAVTACGTTGPAATTPAPSLPRATILIPAFRFEPPMLEVSRGTTVTWENRDDEQHVIANSPTSTIPIDPDGSYDLATSRFVFSLEPGARASFTFNETGTYYYFCLVHNTMKGVVIVR